MYEQHFGLKKRPFRALATGTDVFVGPQTATAMAAIKKALSKEEAVVTVTGEAGVGKTTIARRAIDGVGDARILVSIGRMQLGYDETLQLLLAGLGSRQLPNSTVQRFATFRRLLQQYAEHNKRVVIVVEDATRIGIDALSELEALTAEDAGVSDGANLVLMADAGIATLLREPKLARLKQRVRLRQSIEPLSASELLGYLKHNFRLAGGDFDTLFGPGCADALHALSEGVPRVVNSLLESALASAAEQGQKQVMADLITRIAKEEFGLTAEYSVADIAQFVAGAEAKADEAEEDVTVDQAEAVEPPPEIETQTAAEPETVSDPEVINEPEALLEPEFAAETEVTADVHADADSAPITDDEDEIPELIQDTLPDLQILAPELASAAEPPRSDPDDAAADEPDPEDTISELTALPELSADDADVPTLFSSGRLEQPAKPAPVADVQEMEADTPDVEPAEETVAAAPQHSDEAPQAVPEAPQTVPEAPQAVPEPPQAIPEPPQAEQPDSVAEPASAAADEDEIPEWERDPTLAELKPDLDALERAMAIAQGSEPAFESEEPTVAADSQAEPPAMVPEITLDREIQAKIEEATEALKQTQTRIDAMEREANEAADANAAPQRATSNKDTAELKQIASELAKAKSIEDVDDKLAETLFGEEFNMIAAEVAAKVQVDAPANDEMELQLEASGIAAAPPAAGLENAAAIGDEPGQNRNKPSISETQAFRLAKVRAMNSNGAPAGAPPSPVAGESIVMGADGPAVSPKDPTKHPESIEDQMSTSMTATLKALSVRPESLAGDDEDNKKKKSGFFSRFKRS